MVGMSRATMRTSNGKVPQLEGMSWHAGTLFVTRDSAASILLSQGAEQILIACHVVLAYFCRLLYATRATIIACLPSGVVCPKSPLSIGFSFLSFVPPSSSTPRPNGGKAIGAIAYERSQHALSQPLLRTSESRPLSLGR